VGGRSYVHRQIEAAKVASLLPMGNKPPSERVARELSPLLDQPDQVAEVWREAVERRPLGKRFVALKAPHIPIYRDQHCHESPDG